MFVSLIAFSVVTVLYGFVWHNLPDKRKDETCHAEGSSTLTTL